ncbi:plasmid stabilization system protein ParE [Mucilaginibacter sp. HD30]
MPFEVSFNRKAETDFEVILNYIAVEFGISRLSILKSLF